MWHRETAWDSSWPVTSENSTGRHPYLILIHISISIEENSTGRHPYRRPMCSAVQSNSCVDKCLISSLMKAAMIISSVMHCYFNHYCFQNYNHFQSIQFLHQAHQMYIYACPLFHLWDMYLYPYLYMCISMSVFVSLILWKLSQVFQTQHMFLYLYLNLYLQLCSVLWKLSSVSDTTTVFSCFPTWPPLHLQLLFIGAFCRRVNTSGLISPQFARQVFASILSTLNIQIWTKERKRGLMSKAYLKVN